MTVSLDRYQRAEREMAVSEARKGFVIHAVVTLLVWALVIPLNVVVADEFPWSIFPVLGMGIGLLAHWWFGYRKADEMTRLHQADIERRTLAMR